MSFWVGQKKYRMLGNRVIAAFIPWMAADDSQNSYIYTFNGAVFFNCLVSIFGAGRSETAGRIG